MYRFALFASAFVLAAFALLSPARADVVAHVNIAEQRMTVSVDGIRRHSWPVSTARAGKHTPVGSFRPQSLVRMHYSSLYNNAPMPYAIFFHGNYAVHGTTETGRLGQPASAGCVRLHTQHAQMLYGLVHERGMGNVRIVLEQGGFARSGFRFWKG